VVVSQTTARRSLTRDEKRVLTLLGLPTLTLALGITVVTTYVPKLAQQFTSDTTIIGLIVGGEGFLALFVPLIVGSWSDRLDTRLGSRLPFLIAATPLLVASLAVVGFMNSLLGIALTVLAFFLAYFVAYEPYRALYPDLVPDEIAGRGQSTQAIWRGAGTGLALVAGGVLYGVGKAVPFVAAAVVAAASMAFFTVVGLRRRRRRRRESPTEPARDLARGVWELVRSDSRLRAYLVANALWELSLGALKSFVILYITTGLGYSVFTAAAIVGAVALVVLAAAPVSGQMSDRFGSTAVLRVALPVYGVGLLVPFFVHSPWVLGPVLPLIAFGGGVIMTLPYAMLIPLMPEGGHGALTGFYSLSRGIGVMLGPLLAGVAVSVFQGPLSGTHGYAAMWLVCSVSILASVPLVKEVGDG
jgi:MFS family permease